MAYLSLKHGDESLSDVVRVVGFRCPEDPLRILAALPNPGWPSQAHQSSEGIGPVPNDEIISTVFLPVQF